MIFDRTIEDVEQATRIFEEKVKNFIALSDAEITTLERGRVTANTLNRIEGKQAEIAEILKKWHYLKSDIQNKEWNTEVFRQEDLQRIVENLATLKNSFYVQDESRAPQPRFYFEEFNLLEKILLELTQMLENTEKSFKRCGTFFASQSVLPLKGEIL